MSHIDLTRLTFTSLASSNQPLLLPWMHTYIRPCTGFDSRYIASPRGPWIDRSPFDDQDISSLKLEYTKKDNAKASYKEAVSSSHATSSEHYSGSLGITVGCPFLKANVTGTYDRMVMKSADANKVSLNSSFRCGTIKLSREPALNKTALAYLASRNGEEIFRETYGDYYVLAYEVGADAGAFMSVASDSTDTTDRATLTVTVKVLFWSKSHTETTSKMTHESHLQWCFSGYDTLSQRSEEHRTGDGTGLGIVVEANGRYLDGLHGLESRVLQSLEAHEVSMGKSVPVRAVEKICKDGMVAQVLLVPFSSLKEYKVAVLNAEAEGWKHSVGLL